MPNSGDEHDFFPTANVSQRVRELGMAIKRLIRAKQATGVTSAAAAAI